MHPTDGSGAPAVAEGLDAFSRAVLARARRAHPDLGGRVTSPSEARRLLRAAQFPTGPPVGEVTDLTVPGGSPGSSLRLRVYDGVRAEPPTMVYLHGGGFVIGDLETHDGLCRTIVAGTGWRVVAVDYRLAPEDPFPAAVHDAAAAVRWARVRWGGGPVLVGGDSAGGALAAVVAREAAPGEVAGQVLLYPVTDLTREWVDDPLSLLTGRHMRWYRDQYAPPAVWSDPTVSPLRASDLTGVPPAVVLIAEHDPLAPEGAEYAARLAGAGTAVEVVTARRLSHGTLGMGAVLPDVQVAEEQLMAALLRLEARIDASGRHALAESAVIRAHAVRAPLATVSPADVTTPSE